MQLIIQQDSREKVNKKDHILEYFESVGIKVVRSKLFVGDYCLLHKQDVVIDVKMSVLELFNNLTQSHIRFRNECIRAKENGIQLIILTEEQLPKGGLLNWKSPIYKSDSKRHKKGDLKTKANPETMRKIMIKMQDKYGVKFLFCDKKDTGRFIVYLLTKES